MAEEKSPVNQCPLLESLVRQKGMKMIGTWRHKDVAQLFDTSVRTIQEWEANPEKRLSPRDLPNGVRYLSEDLEEFLRNSGTRRPRRGPVPPAFRSPLRQESTNYKQPGRRNHHPGASGEL
jgi:hypothetical protein